VTRGKGGEVWGWATAYSRPDGAKSGAAPAPGGAPPPAPGSKS